MRIRHFAAAFLFVLGLSNLAAAQAWNIDARSIGMGGVGGSQNPVATTIAEQRGDRTIVLPLGLFQVFRDRNIFDPQSPDFDPLRAVELVTNPMHLEFGRSGPTRALVVRSRPPQRVDPFRSQQLSRLRSAVDVVHRCRLAEMGLHVPPALVRRRPEPRPLSRRWTAAGAANQCRRRHGTVRVARFDDEPLYARCAVRDRQPFDGPGGRRDHQRLPGAVSARLHRRHAWISRSPSRRQMILLRVGHASATVSVPPSQPRTGPRRFPFSLSWSSEKGGV